MKNRLALVLAVILLWTAGCGPATSKKDRWAWDAYDDKEWVQEKDGIVIENRAFHQYPAELLATAQACRGGQLLRDLGNQPVMEQVYLAPPGSRFYSVTITNNTTHMIRLNRTVFRMMDPSGNQYEPLSAEDMAAMLQTNRPCPSTQQLLPRYKMAKLYNRNIEIVPHTSQSGWLVFKPASFYMPGVWKLGIYEIPSDTDEAGRVKRTTNFELRSVLKHYVDHYYQDNVLAPPQLKSSEEVQ